VDAYVFVARPVSGAAVDSSESAKWLEQFRAGERGVLEECYREQFSSVEHVVGRVLTGADRETVIHEIFLRLMTNADLRSTFQGGSFRSWICIGESAQKHSRHLR